MESNVTVSIIVCTCNRAADLKRALAALGRLKIRHEWQTELVVVDNASTDDTAQVVKDTELPNMAVRYVSESKRGLSNARNAGLKQARGEYLLFTDDDAHPAEDWVEQMIAVLARGDCEAVTGLFRPAAHLVRHWMRPMHRLWLAESIADSPNNPARELVGGNMGFRRSVLSKVEAFDPELGAGALGYGEEVLFGRQLSLAGMKIQYVPQAQVIHHLDSSRLRRLDWLVAARKRGQSEAYVQHHWEHLDTRFPRAKWIYNLVKLQLRRLAQPPPPLEHEGCPPWEMSYVLRLEMYKRLCFESRRSRNYDRHGLKKKAVLPD